jgi:hypothetical protein
MAPVPPRAPKPPLLEDLDKRGDLRKPPDPTFQERMAERKAQEEAKEAARAEIIKSGDVAGTVSSMVLSSIAARMADLGTNPLDPMEAQRLLSVAAAFKELGAKPATRRDEYDLDRLTDEELETWVRLADKARIT